MSQHRYSTIDSENNQVLVIMGYDRALDYVHMTVSGAGGRILYSNVSDPAAGTHQQEVDYYRAVLNSLHIAAPESLFEQVYLDQMLREGNRLAVHAADGTFCEDDVCRYCGKPERVCSCEEPSAYGKTTW